MSFYCLSVFPPLWSTQLKLGRKECPSENSCLSSKDRHRAGEEEGEGCLEQRAQESSCVHRSLFPSPVRLSVHSSLPVMRVEVSEVTTPNPAEIKSPAVLAAQGPPRGGGLFPFLSLRITEAQMTDMN